MTPGNVHLLLFALASIVLMVVMVAWAKVHPFLSLLIVSLALGLVAGMPMSTVVKSFETGVGSVLGHIAVVVALGTMMGKLMAESGGANRVAATLIRVFGERHLPWAMMLIGILVGLPVFFEVGFVLLMPIAFTVARRTGKSIVLVAMPMIAGLSVVHAFIPPHPAAMAAVGLFHADLGRTMGYALIVGLPAAVLGGPLWSMWISKRIPAPPPGVLAQDFAESETASTAGPSFTLTVATILLPVVLMLLGGWADSIAPAGSRINGTIHLLGTPVVALLAGVLLSLVTFGLMQGSSRDHLLALASASLPPTAGALLMIGAGGGFGRILTDTGMSAAVVELTQHMHLSLIVVTWLLAALVRVATGSSTVAMTTAASVVAPIAAGARPELLVLAAGAGSIVLSHVNDGGFWLVKEYWNLSVPDTFKTWTACETILSVTGLLLVLALSAIR